MKIDDPTAYTTTTELEVMERCLPMKGKRVLELGCGGAAMTRKMAERFQPAEIIATEVDRVQHEKNLRIDDLPNVRFVYGGAERIDLADASVDFVIMLKSLHHVPVVLMDQALTEIHRVLQPQGVAYISEPVYAGDFNEIMRLFNDERQVRRAAFDALCRAVERGLFNNAGEIFFNAPREFRDFADFEERMLNVTHTELHIDDALYQKIRTAFNAHLGEGGAKFLVPSRVNLLQKP
ncbi:MAG: class I SAM-dependent methyltransferase [Gammaproteobacteria bacterium]